jgi:hypothetical protein
MCRTLRILTCLMGLSLLAGCTVAEPRFRPDLGGYAMIDEQVDQAVATQRAEGEERQSNS